MQLTKKAKDPLDLRLEGVFLRKLNENTYKIIILISIVWEPHQLSNATLLRSALNQNILVSETI
jgi:hypothetical protein